MRSHNLRQKLGCKFLQYWTVRICFSSWAKQPISGPVWDKSQPFQVLQGLGGSDRLLPPLALFLARNLCPNPGSDFSVSALPMKSSCPFLSCPVTPAGNTRSIYILRSKRKVEIILGRYLKDVGEKGRELSLGQFGKDTINRNTSFLLESKYFPPFFLVLFFISFFFFKTGIQKSFYSENWKARE